jgi:hypothetical protein
MTNYTKLTAFDTKDALSTGDPLKRVKGTELDDEFDAISTAIATKADTTGPTFSGTTTVNDLVVGDDITVSGSSALQDVTGTTAVFSGTASVGGVLSLGSSISYEGTDDAFETTIVITDPTADRTITFPDKTGTVALTSDIDTATIASSSGTYSASGSTTITVSMSSHGRLVGDLVYLNFTSGTAADGEFTIASVINTNTYTVTHGTSITTSGSVTQYYSTLGQVRLASPAEILVGSNDTKAITPYAYQTSKFGHFTAVATTSGTAVDFTDIPSWARRITVVLSGVSTTSTSPFLVQIGSSGTVETSSYVGTCHYLGGSGVANTGMSTGFLLTYSTTTTDPDEFHSGAVVLTNISSNIWVVTGNLNSNGQRQFVVSGTKTLSGELNIVRFTTVSGSNTFDAGLVNILYE